MVRTLASGDSAARYVKVNERYGTLLKIVAGRLQNILSISSTSMIIIKERRLIWQLQVVLRG